MRNLMLFTALSGFLAATAAADPLTDITPGVAIGSLNRSQLPAASQYVLRSTVLEQLKSRGVPTMDANTAPYVYLARVGVDTVAKGCIYHVTAVLVPNEASPTGERKSLWSREFTSAPVECGDVSTQMNKTLEGFAADFASDSTKGLIRNDQPVSAQK